MVSQDQLLVHHHGLDIELHAEAALYLVEEDVLVVSDLHLGRSTHFRSHGIALPARADHDDVNRLEALILRYEPGRLLLLGDLFHSTYNHIWEAFVGLTHRYPGTSFILVEGNHDILPETAYQRCAMQVVDRYTIGTWLCTHHPEPQEDYVNVYGHLHPGVVLKGKGRQHIRARAFIFKREAIIMPAFGRMTGAMAVQPETGDTAYIIVDKRIYPISPHLEQNEVK